MPDKTKGGKAPSFTEDLLQHLILLAEWEAEALERVKDIARSIEDRVRRVTSEEILDDPAGTAETVEC